MIKWNTGFPDKRGNYIVTVKVTSKTDKEFDERFVCTDHYNGDGNWTTHNKKHDCVVAWADLPECFNE